MVGLSVDRAGHARVLLGRGHGRVVGLGLLREAGLRVVRAHALFRARSVRARADPQLQVVRAGLHGRRPGSGAGSEPESNRWTERRQIQQAYVLPHLHLDLASAGTSPANGPSVEVSLGFRTPVL